jgi:hypothetical protein
MLALDAKNLFKKNLGLQLGIVLNVKLNIDKYEIF